MWMTKSTTNVKPDLPTPKSGLESGAIVTIVALCNSFSMVVIKSYKVYF